MGTIHTLPTDKPSRIYTCGSALYINKVALEHNTNQNMYITSDEEIKEGDWYLTNKNTLCKCIKTDSKYVYSLEGGSNTNCKKIIITTDQDLIKDGVQAIDDEFLEWFVKNSSCEEVEIINTFDYIKKGYVSHSGYKIQITKEEECKQELERGITITHTDKKQTAVDWLKPQIELMLMDGYKTYPKQLEEAFEIAKDLENQKQGYSDEDIINALHSVELKDNKDYSKIYNGMKEWFEKSKNK